MLIHRRLFSFMKIDSRIFEDKDMRHHNNLIHLARTETRRILPSDVESDLVLSLKTDTEENSENENTLNQNDQKIFCRHFVFHLIISIARFTDGKATWNEMFFKLNIRSQKNHMRFNINLNESLKIINANKMTSLQIIIRTESEIREKVRILTMKRLIFKFYFTLDYSSTNKDDYIHYQNIIRCRNDNRTMTLDLIRLMRTNMKFIINRMSLGALSINSLKTNICFFCFRYQKRVTLHVHCITDVISIYLKIRDTKCKISEFPQSIISFLICQQMNTPFEALNHENLDKIHCFDCANKKRKQRHDESDEKEWEKKWQIVIWFEINSEILNWKILKLWLIRSDE